jgi:hypothetical protein
MAARSWLTQRDVDASGNSLWACSGGLDVNGSSQWAYLAICGCVDQGLSQRGTQTLGADGGDEMLEVLLQMMMAIRMNGG